METHRATIEGAAGCVEIAYAIPAHPAAVAVVAHPHPLFGGTMDNKVVTTVAKAFADAGAAAFRFNFRGVGASEGRHDEGRGEPDDFLEVAAPASPKAFATVVTTLLSIVPPKSGWGCATTATATGCAGIA